MEAQQLTNSPLDDAQKHLDCGANDKAMDLAMLALVAGNDVPRAFRIAGRAMQCKGMHRDAIVWLNRSLAAESDPLTHVWRGWSLYQRRQISAAIADYQQALALEPDLGIAHHYLGIAYRQTKDFASAESEFLRAAASTDVRAAALADLGQLRMQDGRGPQAKEDLIAAADAGNESAAVQLTAIEPDFNAWSGGSLLALASYYRSQGRASSHDGVKALEVAIGKLTDATKTHDAWMALGHARVGLSQFDGASDAYRQAAELQPQGPAAEHIGLALYWAGRYPEAEAALVTTIGQGRATAKAHQILGEICAREGRNEEALVPLAHALVARSPNVGDIEFVRGYVLDKLGRADECKAAWLAAESANHARAGAARRQRFGSETAGDFFDDALDLIDRRDWTTALAPLERAAVLYREATRAPGDYAARQLSNVLNNVGHALREARRFDDAVIALEEACRAYPTGYSPQITLGNLLLDVAGLPLTGPLLDPAVRRNTALVAFDSAVDVAGGEPAAHYARGRCLMALGNGVRAARDFEVALAYENAALREDALFNLVKALWKAGAFAEARAACAAAYAGEDLETAARRNVEAMVAGRRSPEGDAMSARFADCLDVILATPATEAGTSHPFRFYGGCPGDWENRPNARVEYRLRFRTPPDANEKRLIAGIVSSPWEHTEVDGGWLWTGPFAKLSVGPQVLGDSSSMLDCFDEVATMITRIHDVAALEEAVGLHAKRISRGAAGDWERWSLSVQPLPTAHPFDFDREDGKLFFSAYGDPDGFAKPAIDAEFEAHLRGADSQIQAEPR